jgi:peptide/nickel transport system permease protein
MGLVVVEQVFTLSGLRMLLLELALNADYNMVNVLAMVVVSLTIFVKFVVDILYTWVAPRIRYSENIVRRALAVSF